jgi:hypothetical protein
MNKEDGLRATERRERRIDEALKETFPASDPPSFIGAGAPTPTEKKAKVRVPRKAADMAGDVIDQHADLLASSEEQASRKRRLLKGPKEFRDLRRDHPSQKRLSDPVPSIPVRRKSRARGLHVLLRRIVRLGL